VPAAWQVAVLGHATVPCSPASGAVARAMEPPGLSPRDSTVGSSPALEACGSPLHRAGLVEVDGASIVVVVTAWLPLVGIAECRSDRSLMTGPLVVCPELVADPAQRLRRRQGNVER
jgi:hypothetical protein